LTKTEVRGRRRFECDEGEETMLLFISRKGCNKGKALRVDLVKLAIFGEHIRIEALAMTSQGKLSLDMRH